MRQDQYRPCPFADACRNGASCIGLPTVDAAIADAADAGRAATSDAGMHGGGVAAQLNAQAKNSVAAQIILFVMLVLALKWRLPMSGSQSCGDIQNEGVNTDIIYIADAAYIDINHHTHCIWKLEFLETANYMVIFNLGHWLNSFESSYIQVSRGIYNMERIIYLHRSVCISCWSNCRYFFEPKKN